MRIDFRQAFNRLSPALEPKQPAGQNQPVKGDFGVLIGDVLGKKPPVTSSSYTQIEQKVARHPDEILARLQFDPPATMSPAPEAYLGEQDVLPGVKTSSLEAPEMLSVRRVKVSAALNNAQMSEGIKQVKAIVQGAGKRHGVDPMLSMAVISAESAFNADAVSSDGHNSKGLFQLLDSTGISFHAHSQYQDDPYNPFDAKQNVEIGTSYLRHLHEIFSTPTKLTEQLETHAAANSSSLEDLAVAAFNAGEGRVAAAQARALSAGGNPAEYHAIAQYLPESTRQYVERVRLAKNSLRTTPVG